MLGLLIDYWQLPALILLGWAVAWIRARRLPGWYPLIALLLSGLSLGLAVLITLTTSSTGYERGRGGLANDLYFMSFMNAATGTILTVILAVVTAPVVAVRVVRWLVARRHRQPARPEYTEAGDGERSSERLL